MRVGQEAQVEYQIRVNRQPILEAEGHDAYDHGGARGVAAEILDQTITIDKNLTITGPGVEKLVLSGDSDENGDPDGEPGERRDVGEGGVRECRHSGYHGNPTWTPPSSTRSKASVNAQVLISCGVVFVSVWEEVISRDARSCESSLSRASTRAINSAFVRFFGCLFPVI